MLRRSSFFAVLFPAALALPLALAGSMYGCSSNESVQDLCLWLGKSGAENRYRRMNQDLRVTDEKTGVTRVACGVTDKDLSEVQGTFLSRDKLDICFFGKGGQAVFDPPIDLTQFPPAGQQSVKILDINGNECGAVAVTTGKTFSITVNPPADAGQPPCKLDAGADDQRILGGTFSSQLVEGRDLIEVSCPCGESYRFNSLQIQQCEEYAEILPQAVFDYDLGGVQKTGYVKLTVHFPPANESGSGSGGSSSSGGGSAGTKTIEPDKIVYLNCTIPGAPRSCEDGEKNGAETDVDCGGIEAQAACPNRCDLDQGCICNSDCAPGLVCGVKNGIRVCQSSATTTFTCNAGQACRCGQNDCASGNHCERSNSSSDVGLCMADIASGSGGAGGSGNAECMPSNNGAGGAGGSGGTGGAGGAP